MPWDQIVAYFAIGSTVVAIYLFTRGMGAMARDRNEYRKRWAEDHGYELIDPILGKKDSFRHGAKRLNQTFLEQFVKPSILRFGPGYSYNIIQGVSKGTRFKMFDHLVKVNKGESKYSVVILELPMLIPAFTITPKANTWLKRLMHQKEESIAFPGLAEYLSLETRDHGFALEKLNEQFFTDVIFSRALRWHSDGRRLIIVRDGHCSNEEFEALLSQGTAVASRLMKSMIGNENLPISTPTTP